MSELTDLDYSRMQYSMLSERFTQATNEVERILDDDRGGMPRARPEGEE